MKDAGGSDDNGEDVDDDDDGRRTNVTSFYARVVHRNYTILFRVYVIIRK